MDPTPERFRRLARSAAYRWRGLVLEGVWEPETDPVRVWVEQPDWSRVERLDGAALSEGRYGSLGSGGEYGSGGFSPDPVAAPVPEYDEDGLVAGERWPSADGPEVPMGQSYYSVAVLDPYELSDGVELLEVRAVDHGGRPAWEAVLRPTPDYDPRCPCCPLMATPAAALALGDEPAPAYADAHLIRLDVGTGVCVRAREVGGPRDGWGHDLVVVVVNP